MLQSLEIYLLTLIQDFYRLPQVVGILTLGAASISLFMYQFLKRKEQVIPGIFAIAFFILEFYHFFHHQTIIDRIDGWILDILTPDLWVRPLPTLLVWLEPLFSFFVAPLETRHVLEETLFVVIITYFAILVRVSLHEFKKTGVIFGEISPTSLKSKYIRPTRSKTNELGSGDLATTEQIAKWTRPSGERGDTSFAFGDLRGSEGLAFKSGSIHIPAEQRNRHILVIAKTGSGKTTKVILPILYNDCLCPFRSTIVIDSKPEMWKKLAAMTRKYNPEKNIFLFNPLDPTRSLSWNILGKIEDDTDCKLISNTIISATDNPAAKSDSPFFRNNALAILNAVMVGLLHDPNETLSMPRIHELVQSGMRSLCDWLEAHPAAIRTAKTFVELARSGSQNADTIMSELSMRLAAWDLSAIRTTTALNELDLDDIVKKPTLFIVELRESELEMLRPLANVIVVELMRFLTKSAERCPGVALPRPVSIVIDEFASSIGRLPDIHVKLNTLRSRNISIVAAIQSLAQIKACYADNADSVIAGFNTKILMPTLELSDAEWASKETGQMTIRFQTASSGSNRKMIEFFASQNDSKQEQVQQRAVLTPDEIGRPVEGVSTFFLPETPVFQGHLVPFYKIPEMLKRITEFDSEDLELRVRSAPINYNDQLQGTGAPAAYPAGGSGAAPYYGTPPGISDTTGWTDEQVLKKLEEVKKKLDWDNTTGSAKKWWEAFESENKTRMALVLRLAEELAVRNATITEFFLAYVYSNTDNIQANLYYLDYTRLKKEEEKKKKEQRDAAAKSAPGGAVAA